MPTPTPAPRIPDSSIEASLLTHGFVAIAGVDEVGRGPLAGPVVAGAVILPSDLPADGLELLRDSKQLTAPQREEASRYIETYAIAYACGASDHTEIDRMGIVYATRQAMARAVEMLEPCADHLLVDAMDLPAIPLPQISLIKGDARCRSIAAASIVAKVTRDRLMTQVYETRYPGYGFASHKGYATREHLYALARLGPIPGHRMSFAPVRQVLEANGVAYEADSTVFRAGV